MRTRALLRFFCSIPGQSSSSAQEQQAFPKERQLVCIAVVINLSSVNSVLQIDNKDLADRSMLKRRL